MLAKIFNRNEELPWQFFENETVVINPEAQDPFELNEIGSFVWTRLDGVSSVAHIQQQICSEYDVSADAVQEDLEQLFDAMSRKRLIIETSR